MRKPFYNKKWFWLTMIAALVIITATSYVAENTYEDKADSDAYAQENLFKKTVDSKTSIIDKFNAVKLGAGGSTHKAVDSKFGKAVVSSNAEDNNNATLSWSNLKGLDDDVVIDITFHDGRAVAKSIKGLDIDRKNDLTMKDFKTLKTGNNYEQVIDLLGNPDNYTETNGIVTLTYTSDVEEKINDNTAYIKVSLVNDEVTSKSQVNVK
ncbi:DUF3862 domain-containing protein [Companilactobacillus jidongensis]|uniref:DUF3862 domain-containing protein n=1 Tax=Companilactobacillus jidongensis TaxID=2486006 RepID=UPI0013DE42F7|nr:DUF3862 domain-containing protein [Companilactobacillus jidongensis]